MSANIDDLDKFETQTASYDPDYNPGFKIYSFWQIVIAAFLCFIAGIVMLSHNFRKFGNKKAANLSWAISVPVLILITTLYIIVPEQYSIILFPLPLAVFFSIWGIASKYQRDKIEYHLDQGEDKYSWWRVVGLIALIALIYLAVFLIYAIYILILV